MSLTLGGTALTKYLSHLLAGVKLVDARAGDPQTIEPLFLRNKYQSRDLCFPMKIRFEQDSKQAYHVVMKTFSYLAMKKLNELDLWPWFILLDIWTIFYYLFTLPSVWKSPQKNWN